MEQESHKFSTDDSKRRVLDAISEPLSNGWRLSVHWERQLVNILEVPNGDTEEEYLVWWEGEKRKYNSQFVQFVDTFGLEALLTSARVGNGKGFAINIWFKDSDTEEGLCFVKEIEIQCSQRLIDIFISV